MRRIVKKNPFWIWTADLDREFDGANDRAVAIIAAAYLEMLLDVILEEFLIDHKKVSDLFGAYRPLGGFSAKISMSFSLGLISESEYKNLETIRGIRNKFAHELRVTSFEDQAIKDRCANLFIPDRMHVPSLIPMPTEGQHVELDITPPEADNPRELFKATYSYLLLSLSMRWLIAREHKRTIPMDFDSAAECKRMSLTYFDKSQEQLRAQAEELSRKLAELGEEIDKPQDDPSGEEPDLVRLFELARPLEEYTIALLDEAYARYDAEKEGLQDDGEE